MPTKAHDAPMRQRRAQRLEERYGKIGISAVKAAALYSGKRHTAHRSSKGAKPVSIQKKEREPTRD